ncbi:uncharacterized protein si:cabz01007802.1 isoform X2 [Alosa alosa]|uniref:uncharacterized protein si:cabz01007802.1 isoform X2 n=1 Tax=Alosa alosa TaxID=278164 RepID=UPI0020154723|nr:uncharacterized protein si:cabz01007802.1 isoform X2 [Alosa alosa]
MQREKATPLVPPRPTKDELDNPVKHSLGMDPDIEYKTEWYYHLNNNEGSSELAPKRKTGMMGMMQKVNPFKSSSQSSSAGAKMEATAVTAEGQGPDTKQNPGMFVGQKVNLFAETRKAEPLPNNVEDQTTDKNSGMFMGMMQKVNPFKSSAQTKRDEPEPSAHQATEKRFPSTEEMRDDRDSKQAPGMFMGVMQKVNPFKSSQQGKQDEQLVDPAEPDERKVEEKQNPGMFRGVMQKVNPFKSTTQDSQSLKSDSSISSDSLAENNNTATKQQTVKGLTDGELQPTERNRKKKTFIIRRILPGALFGSASKEYEHQPSEPGEEQPDAQEQTVEILPVEMAEVPVPGQGNPLEDEADEDGLLDWWRTVEGWKDWNESTSFEEGEEELAVEAAADRVFMAARLFVRLFNMRGASLQGRILELLALADAADTFHKKTVTASVGGGVASVAGSITTITGLVLAPFTLGTSLIVTAVGIGVATAGGLTSASANITDTVHSKTDRKKVEKMIQDYQEEIKDIKECLEFLQTGMETLEEWHFEQYMESLSKRAMNQNVKHVMKEGGRAGKALLINTESLVSTVQVLSVAGSAAKAAQVMSVTTGVMSGLFLALDVFFLAKDSVELRKGAKTEFATKLREVCKDLQDGLLELNHIKEELQKTMDGIEVDVEEESESEEEEEEDDEGDEEFLKSDPKKLAQLEE